MGKMVGHAPGRQGIPPGRVAGRRQERGDREIFPDFQLNVKTP
jgi:hypothetical protein